jgi:hypothetical protein
MATVEVRAFIQATPERVWQIIADLEGQKHWMVDVSSLEIVGEKRSGAGAVLELTSRLFGLPVVKDIMEVTTWDPPRELGVVHRGQFSGSGAFRLEPQGCGTLFTWWEDFKAPLGELGELGHSWIIKPHLERVFSRSLANLKWIAERAG